MAALMVQIEGCQGLFVIRRLDRRRGATDASWYNRPTIKFTCQPLRTVTIMIEPSQIGGDLAQSHALLAAQILNGTTFEPGLFIHPGPDLPSTPERDIPNERKKRSMLEEGTDHFRARMEIEGLKVRWPEISFNVFSGELNSLTLEGQTRYPWPRVRIDLELDTKRKPKLVKGVRLEPAARTADAEIFYTRIIFALKNHGIVSLHDLDNNSKLELRVYTDNDDEWFTLRSKLARKLKFIERAFQRQFRLPEEARKSDATRIEMIFRCLVEAHFRQRREVLNIHRYVPMSEELTRPPFSAPGRFEHSYRQTLELFSECLNDTLISVCLEHAQVLNLDTLKQSINAGEKPDEVSFRVLNHQITYRFPEYQQSAQSFREKLAEFREELLRDEPVALVDLLTASIENHVSDEEARLIIVGWLQYHHFPDGFWPQDPVSEGDKWRVPIWIAYPGLEAPVEDLFVDRETGEVETPVPAQELLERGGSVARALLRAS